MHSEESGKAFDEAELEEIGREIEKLETALGNIKREEADCIIGKEKTLFAQITIKFISLTIIIFVLIKTQVKQNI